MSGKNRILDGIFDEPLTHKCGVCKKMRPESHIGVNRKEGYIYSVLYCIDSENCVEESGVILNELIRKGAQ